MKMIEYFSDGIDSKIFSPSYPQVTRQIRAKKVHEKASDILFGDPAASETIVRFRPQVIYTDSPLYAWHLKLQSFIEKYSIPTIVHLRGDLWREFFGWLMRSPMRSRLLGSPVYFESMFGVTSADMITPICRWLQREVQRRLPWKPSEVVYQGVDPSDFFPSPGLRLAHPAVAIIQNHTVYEKTLGLLRFARVVEKLPDVHFYITSGEDVRQAYFQLVQASFSCFKNVHFLRGIGHPEGVRRLLTSADLYVLPSNLDCCPTTILEASLMEKPVLGSRVGGIPEIISDGYTGWSIQNEDYDEWVSRIRMLTDNVRLSRRLGAQGRRWVAENFGWAKIASRVEQLIDETAHGRFGQVD